MEHDQPDNGRDRLGRFVPGNNVARGHGRPHGSASVRSACQRLIAEKSVESRDKADEIAKTVYDILMDPTAGARDRIRAAEFFRKAVDGDRIAVADAEPFEVTYDPGAALADLAAGSTGDHQLNGTNHGNRGGPS